jgi:hypothetical protein
MDQVPAIRAFVDVRSHPTVVRLEHLRGDGAEWISDQYVTTSDVARHLAVLTELLGRPLGCGVFLIGQYGSGKSHFLAFVAQGIRAGKIAAAGAEPVAVSLLDFPAHVPLEEVVGGALGIDPRPGDRRAAWARLSEKYPGGVLLLIDELSEFLRSKSDRAAYHEDVRYLQFLGEQAQATRFWVLGAMQEQIEHTGSLDHQQYRKLKDRYPILMLLTPTHVRDLLARGVLVRKPGYAQRVAALCRELRDGYPNAPLDFGELAELYPVHPATLRLLEEVRGSFSQTRGVVDFVVTRLRGDAARGAAPFLDEPWGSLLTADLVIDHFQDLLAVQPDFVDVSRQVLPYYRERMPELFATEKARTLAERILKLLILCRLSPVRQGLTAAEAAAWLLATAVRSEPERNVQVVARVLTKLVAEGRYVAESGGRFRLDLADDGSVELDRLLAQQRAELGERDTVVFEMLAPLLEDAAFDPLKLPQDVWQRRAVRWHSHDRAYALWVGNAAPDDAPEPLALCVRLPWGEAPAVRGAFTLQPAALAPDSEMLGMCAMARLTQRPLRREVAARLENRLAEARELLRARVREAFASGTITGPDGVHERALPIDPKTRLQDWLDGLARWALVRRFPSFDRVAPCFGPLAHEVYRSFLRHSLLGDVTDPRTEEHLTLVREAYLLPMDLLERRGRDLVAPARLDRKELVRLVSPMFDHQPSPKVVYQRLAEPPWGLVPDQVHLLLLLLLVQGEIDIVKGGKSIREVFEALPLPLSYDKIVPGRALPLEAVKELERLCEGLAIPVPRQWTVGAQKHAVGLLRRHAAAVAEQWQPLLAKLQSLERGRTLAARIAEMLSLWRALDKGDSDLGGFEHFLFEIGSSARLLALLEGLGSVAGRLDSLVAGLDRAAHLLAHPHVTGWQSGAFLARIAALGTAPELSEVDAAAAWIERANALYGEYVAEYRAAHDAWWRARDAEPVWSWAPAAVAASRHLGLARELHELRDCRARALRDRCSGHMNLDFHPRCTCGFDGETCPGAADIDRFRVQRERIERELALFFAQDSVRDKVAQWKLEGTEMSEGTLAYLQGSRAVPDVADVARFDRHLSGATVVRHIPAAALVGCVAGRTWERQSLLAAVGELLGDETAARVRFDAPEEPLRDELVSWCAEQAFRQGIALPAALGSQAISRVAALLREEWVGEPALRQMHAMGLDQPSLERVAAAIADGRVSVPDGELSPVAEAARELRAPSRAGSPERLASLAERLYAQHPTMMRVARERWLARLESLADEDVGPLPELAERLASCRTAQWLVVDCAGLPMLSMLGRVAGAQLEPWRLERTSFAVAPATSTTDAFWRELAAAGLNHAVVKVNALDELLHDRFEPFEDLERLAEAELAVALRRRRAELDPGLALVIVADHGFRISGDGARYEHGGRSTLERVVPVLEMAARGR